MTVVTFNNLPEAQAYAIANGIIKYWRVWFQDQETANLRGRGGWWTTYAPAFRIYMNVSDAMACVEQRARGIAERTTIETLWTDEVSNSSEAR